MTATTDSIREEILERLSDGENLTDICNTDGYPSRKTVCNWIGLDEAYRESYIRARELGCDARADALKRTALDDSLDPLTRKLVIETERWLLARQAPNRYGDRTALQMLDEHGKPAKAGITIIVDGAPGE